MTDKSISSTKTGAPAQPPAAREEAGGSMNARAYFQRRAQASAQPQSPSLKGRVQTEAKPHDPPTGDVD